MSAHIELMLWATRIVGKGATSPNQVLEIRDDAGLDEAQAAFHKVARMAHPDLHRASLSAADLELVTTAYSRVAGAYQEYRTLRMQATKLPRPNLAPVNNLPTAATAPKAGAAPKPGPGGAAGAMTPKGLIYFRKAEALLRRGDLKGAVLQLKIAIATDPLSTMLRQALAEVESEIAKGSP